MRVYDQRMRLKERVARGGLTVTSTPTWLHAMCDFPAGSCYTYISDFAARSLRLLKLLPQRGSRSSRETLLLSLYVASREAAKNAKFGLSESNSPPSKPDGFSCSGSTNRRTSRLRARLCYRPLSPAYFPNRRALDWKSRSARRKSTFLSSAQLTSRKKSSE